IRDSNTPNPRSLRIRRGGLQRRFEALRSYRREWDEERATWKDRRRHDWGVTCQRRIPLFGSVLSEPQTRSTAAASTKQEMGGRHTEQRPARPYRRPELGRDDAKAHQRSLAAQPAANQTGRGAAE